MAEISHPSKKSSESAHSRAIESINETSTSTEETVSADLNLLPKGKYLGTPAPPTRPSARLLGAQRRSAAQQLNVKHGNKKVTEILGKRTVQTKPTSTQTVLPEKTVALKSDEKIGTNNNAQIQQEKKVEFAQAHTLKIQEVAAVKGTARNTAIKIAMEGKPKNQVATLTPVLSPKDVPASITLPENLKSKPIPPAPLQLNLAEIKKSIQNQGNILKDLSKTPVEFAPSKHEKAVDPDIVEYEKQRRQMTQGMVSDFVVHNSSRLQDFTKFGQTATAQINAAASQAKAVVASTLAQNKAVVLSHFAQQRSAITAQATAARSEITSQFTTTTTAIKNATTAARDTLKTAQEKVFKDIEEKQKAQEEAIKKLYDQMEKEMQPVGTKAGSDAQNKGNDARNNYLNQVKGQDDNPWDGPLTDDRNRARADAAGQVGESYKQELQNAGSEQAKEVRKGETNNKEEAKTNADEAKKLIEEQTKSALESIDKSEQASHNAAQQNQSSNLQALDASQSASLSSLAAEQSATLNKLTTAAQQTKQGIDADSKQAIAAILKQINQFSQQFQHEIDTFVAQFQAVETPEENQILKLLDESQEGLDVLYEQLLDQLTQGLTQSKQGITAKGSSIIGILTEITQGANQSASATGTNFANSAAGVKSSVIQAFSQIQQGHTDSTKATVDTITQAVTQIVADLQDAFQASNKQLTIDLEKAVKSVIDQLNEIVQQKEPTTIKSEADKAADKVEPRWKSVLKVVLVVAVMIAVTVFLPGGGILLAAAIGAASSALLQVTFNAIDGKNLMDGVLEAAITGAISGAAGPLGGALGKVVTQGMKSPLGKALVKAVIETGVNTAGDVVSNLVNHKPWNEGLGISLLTNGLGSLGNLKGAVKLSGVAKYSAKTKFVQNLTKKVEVVKDGLAALAKPIHDKYANIKSALGNAAKNGELGKLGKLAYGKSPQIKNLVKSGTGLAKDISTGVAIDALASLAFTGKFDYEELKNSLKGNVSSTLGGYTYNKGSSSKSGSKNSATNTKSSSSKNHTSETTTSSAKDSDNYIKKDVDAGNKNLSDTKQTNSLGSTDKKSANLSGSHSSKSDGSNSKPKPDSTTSETKSVSKDGKTTNYSQTSSNILFLPAPKQKRLTSSKGGRSDKRCNVKIVCQG